MKRGKYGVLVWRGLEAFPLILPAALAAFSCVAMCLLLLGRLDNSLVWPLGALFAALAGWIVWRNSPIEHTGGHVEHRVFDLLVLSGVVIWVCANVLLTAHSVFITRDPGIYTVTGKWLMTHHTTNIETPSIINGVRGIYNQSSGIWQNVKTSSPNELQPQGAHLLPALLGLLGRIIGDKTFAVLNVLIGGGALLTVYAFARHLVKPRWAAVATAVLAVSLPMLYFTRDTYTEPLAALFTTGGLGLFWIAAKRADYWLWATSGLVIGAGVLTRPDGYLTITAVTAVIFFTLITQTDRRRLNKKIRGFSFFFIGAMLSATLGWLDIANLTTSYYLSQRKIIIAQVALLLLTALFGYIVLVFNRKSNLLARAYGSTKRWLPEAALLLVLLVGLFLVSRPIWLETISKVSSSGIGFVNVLQGQLGDPILPRTYEEFTMQWVSWYLGLPFLLLGVIGLAITFRDAAKGRNTQALAGATVLALSTFIYAIRPTITPDQIWAARRFLSVIFPLFAVYGVYSLEKMIDNYLRRKNIKYTYILWLLIALFLVSQPLISSKPFLLHREKRYDYTALMTYCKALPANALVIWLGSSLENDAAQSTRAFCGVQSLGYIYQSSKTYATRGEIDKITLRQIASQAYRQGYVPIIAMHGSQNTLFSSSFVSMFSPVSVYVDNQLERTLTYPPSKMMIVGNSIELALIGRDGTLTKLTH